MIANLPLLFCNGNPTTLSKITAKELEKFISFMVTCSWGHDTAREIKKPAWWPADVPFTHPFTRPKQVPKDWEARLKLLVKKCYDYHKSKFLLVFSAQLSRYQRKRLRYVDNRDHTTSLYYRPSGRLLVTFRNENIYYDRDLSESKVKGNEMSQQNEDVLMHSTDIYLCDNCDSHFDNIASLESHERVCCGENCVPSEANVNEFDNFLAALKLRPVSIVDSEKPVETVCTRSQRAVRATANVEKAPPFPFSSLTALKNAKPPGSKDPEIFREKLERYCCVIPQPSKLRGNNSKNNQFPIRYKRPIDYWKRNQVFPYQRGKEILDIKGQLAWLKCRPVSVPVERMSLNSMQSYIDNLKQKASEKAKLKSVDIEEDIVFVSEEIQENVTEILGTDPLIRTVGNKTRLAKDPEEVIDLCSDDETESVNENCDPMAGVTCVVRGGAVLRRTAATPRALPDEPCGARERPLQSAVLKPHPVLLFSHSLSNMQIIPID